LELIIHQLTVLLSYRSLDLVLKLLSSKCVSEHVLLIPVDYLLFCELSLDLGYNDLLIMRAHHLVSVLLELVIPMTEAFLFNHLSLGVLCEEAPVFLLFNGFDLLLQVSGLVVDCTRNDVLLFDEVSLSLLHLSDKVGI